VLRELHAPLLATEYDRREQQAENAQERNVLEPAGVDGRAAAFGADSLHRCPLSRFVTPLQYP
jgi:hypothetical protein